MSLRDYCHLSFFRPTKFKLISIKGIIDKHNHDLGRDVSEKVKKIHVGIFSAMTGNGHNSVMQAIVSNLVQNTFEVTEFPRFYEELSESNDRMSQFYNLLQVTSIELCNEYTRMSVLESQKTRKENYKKYWKQNLDKFFENKTFDIILSTTPLINPYIIQYIKENHLEVTFGIVVTDPYIPMYPGFCEVGADFYFVPNETIYEFLIQNGIDSQRVVVTGYPLAPKFEMIRECSLTELKKSYGIDEKKKTILVNCGAQGTNHFLFIIKKLISHFGDKVNIIVICGKNKSLFNLVNKLGDNTKCYGFINDIEKLLAISDICITKAGANAVMESIYLDTFVLVDATKGFLYQEEGIIDFLKSYEVGKVFYNIEQLIELLEIYIDENKKFPKCNFGNGGALIAQYLDNKLNSKLYEEEYL